MSEQSRPAPLLAADDPLDEAGNPLPRAPRAQKLILICDDEPTLRELVRAVLGPGYEYAEAVDGRQALELVRSLAPDLVVLDLMLPQTSGFDVLDAIRNDPALRETPVIVLTAWSHVEAAARAAGADRFVPKPFEPDELESAVREVLGEP